ncbi:MAG: DUF1702 family protein [Phycisphaerae bacterium]|nr:DUF1702 family protein [Phycisphaerae bacterium]
MVLVVYIAVILVAVVLFTGWWRVALAPFKIRADRMTVAKLGLRVPAEHAARVDSILSSFAGGFNAMIAAPSASAWERYCDTRQALDGPFAQEGAAMGYTVRRLFQFDAAKFEARLPRRYPGFRYLHHVGLGFWSGMRNHSPQHLAQVTANLDPLYRYLCYDGYGFKHGFFDYPHDPTSLRKLDALDGYARNAAYQGVGRALFFYFMQDPDLLSEHVAKLGPHAIDAAGGAGLASVFIFPDQMEVPLELMTRLPAEWHKDIHQGMCFGLKARSINDPEQFERDMARLADPVREAIYASIRECDRAETQVRAQRAEDGYQRWRVLVAQWMAVHIDYPLAAVKAPGPSKPRHQPVTT